jgi:CopA family copper-resistance protein
MKKQKFLLANLLFLFLFFDASAQKILEYDLIVRDTLVNYTGKVKKALAINGQIPAPTLYFTEGDTAVIRVHNQTKSETTIHWHGLIVPVEEDGVPYLTTAPTFPGESHTYKFPLKQNGTYFYHSHSGFQQQVGVYGSFIVHKKKNDSSLRTEDKLPEHNILLSDWTDTNPSEIMRRLKIRSDWGEVQKGSVQSYSEAIRKGHLGTKLTNEWKRMSAMDVSDVYYEKYLVNGKEKFDLSQYKAGDKVRLRVINGSSSTYFWLQYAGGKITVIANDGKDVVPVEVDRLIIGVSETYDVVVTIPENMKYEFLFTSEDRIGSASLWLGSGMDMPVKPMGKLDYFAGMKMMNNMMDMSGRMKDMGMPMSLQTMDMNEVMYPEMKNAPKVDHSKMDQSTMNMTTQNHNTKLSDKHEMGDMKGMLDHSMHMSKVSSGITTLNYSMLRSPQKTNLPADKPVRELRFELTGNMDRYVWTLDNKTVSESDKILIKKGENLRIVLYNNSMMRHPMHLHGHFFRVLNGQGDYAPLKTVLDIMPMETDTIEFNASEESGDWYFHCHILYHMMSGMGRLFTYEDGRPNTQIKDTEHALKMVYMDDRMYYLTAQNDFAYNGNFGKMEYSNTRWSLQSEWGIGYKDRHGYEAEVRVGRYLDRMQWLLPYIGVQWGYQKELEHEKNLFGQKQTNHRWSAVVGLRYKLPLLFVVDARVNMYGKVRVQLEREDIAISRRIRMNLSANTDKEYRVGLRYILTPYISISGNYDSDMKWGAGISINY